MKIRSMKNNCYKCPYRGEVPGSTHIRCNAAGGLKNDIQFIAAAEAGYIPSISMEGKQVLKVNETGFHNGWATWPVNFDPVWITCNIPLPEK